MAKLKTIALIYCLCFSIVAVWAFEAANPYWLAIKPKLNQYLKSHINNSKYQYTLIGPTRPMKNFLGNRPGLEIKFSGLNLGTSSMRKTVMATAYDGAKRVASIPIAVDVKVYKRVLTLKRPVNKGEEITPSNVTSKVIAINPRDIKMYYDSGLAQKVATSYMAAGVAIKVNQVRHEKLIQVGDTLKVANENKAIVLEFICKAMKSGDLGETINVHCPDLQAKTKKAKITDEARAVFI